MNTINGIPIVWDTEGDNNLFGSLFPQRNNSNGFVSGIQQTNPFSSNFQNSPFGEYWEKNLPGWALSYFGPAKVITFPNIKIIDITQKTTETIVNNYNHLLTTKINSYKYTIYVYDDGEKVVAHYNNPDVKVADNEVMVFIELDDGKFNFGKIVRVKLGKNVIKDLEDKFLKIDLDSDELAIEIIRKIRTTSDPDAPKVITDINNSADFNSLLINAIDYEYKNKQFDDLSMFMLLIKGLDFLEFKSYGWLLSCSSWLRERKYTEDKYWDGNLKSKYEPAFLPTSIFSKTKEEKEKLIQTSIKTTLNLIDLFVENKFQEKNYITNLIHPKITTFRKELTEKLKPFEAKILKLLEQTTDDLETVIKHINALLVGIWNGVLEFIAGLIDLVGIIILIIKQEVGFRITDQLWEKIENLFNFVYYDTQKFLDKLLDKAITILYEIYYWELDSYKIVKTVGELAPDILTIYISWLKGAKFAKAGTIAEAGLSEEALTKQAYEKLEKESVEEVAKKANKEVEKHLDEILEGVIKHPPKIIVGAFSKRSFDINNCGGKILNLIWEDAKISKEGIEIVKKHLSRFENIPANEKMIERLEKIKKGELQISDWDKRFYTHETREFERYKAMGYENTKNADISKEVWNDTHSATLEDYKISEYDESGRDNIYHPEIKLEDFYTKEERDLLGI